MCLCPSWVPCTDRWPKLWQFWAATPHMQASHFVGQHYKSFIQCTTPCRNKVEHSERTDPVPLFLVLLQCYGVGRCQILSGKKDLVLKVIYIECN
jgi:hypothetical protein